MLLILFSSTYKVITIMHKNNITIINSIEILASYYETLVKCSSLELLTLKYFFIRKNSKGKVQANNEQFTSKAVNNDRGNPDI